MTFTSFFSYFFKGTSTFEDQLILKDITSSEKIAEVIGTLKTIVGVTFFIEGLGALLIYSSLSQYDHLSLEAMYFSVFHSISAFCNAGFSTLANGLYEAEFRFNYSMQIVIALLFIIGGLGFPIVYNLLQSLKYNFMKRILGSKNTFGRPKVININTKVILVTTGILILFGWITFFIFEYQNTLAEHGL